MNQTFVEGINAKNLNKQLQYDFIKAIISLYCAAPGVYLPVSAVALLCDS